MSGAEIHLLFNHFPITGGLLALLLLAWGWGRRNDDVVRAACGLYVLIALATVVTYLSGEPAEHVLEAGAAFSQAEPFVEEHEEAGLFALILYSVLGVAALYTLVRYARRAVPRWLGGVLLVLALASAGAAARVGWLGGPIKHDEVRAGAPAAGGEAGEAAEEDGD